MTLSRLGFIASIAVVSILAGPPAAEAQAGKVLRIGVLAVSAAGPVAPFLAAFRQGLCELGDVEGRNVALEIRYANGRPERLPGLAAELVSLKVDVILATGGNTAIAAAQKATTSIPIVMSNATDPVALGFVASLARPGGNITGLTSQIPDVAGKGLQLLTEAVPHLSRVAVLWDPGYPGIRQYLSGLEAAARTLVVQLQLVEVRSPGELDGAFAAVTRSRAGAAVTPGSSMLMPHRTRMADLAIKRHLPTMCVLREYVEAGCLMGYGTSVADQHRRRRLRGQDPQGRQARRSPDRTAHEVRVGDQPQDAKALGLTIAPSVLLRADHIIE